MDTQHNARLDDGTSMNTHGLWKFVSDNHTDVIRSRTGKDRLKKCPVIWECDYSVQWIMENVVERFAHDHSRRVILHNIVAARRDVKAYKTVGFYDVWNRKLTELRVARYLNAEVDHSVLDQMDELWVILGRPEMMDITSTTEFIGIVRDYHLSVFAQEIYGLKDDFTPWYDDGLHAGLSRICADEHLPADVIIDNLVKEARTARINSVHIDNRELKRRDIIRALSLYGAA